MIPTVSFPGTTVSEYLDGAGSMQPVYRAMMDLLESLGPAALRERWMQAKREVTLDGFSFMLEPKNFRPVPTDWIPGSFKRSSGTSLARAWSSGSRPSTTS